MSAAPEGGRYDVLSPQARKLNPQEVRSVLLGKTAEGIYLRNGSYTYVNKPWTEFYFAEGRSVYREPSFTLQGDWIFKADSMCFRYRRPADSVEHCSILYDDQGIYKFVYADGDATGQVGSYIKSLTPGNSADLPVEP